MDGEEYAWSDVKKAKSLPDRREEREKPIVCIKYVYIQIIHTDTYTYI